MLVFGLVHDRGWEPPADAEGPPERPERWWRLAWRPLAWVALWCWLMALVPVVSSLFGGLAGYAVLMLAVALFFLAAGAMVFPSVLQGCANTSPEPV